MRLTKKLKSKKKLKGYPQRVKRHLKTKTNESYLTLKKLREMTKILKATPVSVPSHKYIVHPAMIDSLNDWHFKSPWNFIKVEDYTPTLPFIQEFENPRSLFFNH